VDENRTWCAPRIRGELKMLGFGSSERTVLRWMRKAPRVPEPAKQWTAFLKNHREAIAAMDFFTVPTLTFGVLYCFFIISHDRRRILHCNITRHPSSVWVTQQLRETFPYDSAPNYLIFDRGVNFNEEVISTIKNFGIEPKRTSFRSPWQNGVAERFVGNCRRDLLDHVIVLNERHLKRLMTSTFATTMTIGRTSVLRSKRLPDERPQGAPRRVAASCRSRDSAASITATTLPLEPLNRLCQFFLDEIKDGQPERHGCLTCPLRFSAFSSRPSATRRSFSAKKQQPKSQPGSMIYVVFRFRWSLARHRP
jgi:transposase InsO family protein